jgi:hypothetical protein
MDCGIVMGRATYRIPSAAPMILPHCPPFFHQRSHAIAHAKAAFASIDLLTGHTYNSADRSSPICGSRHGIQGESDA